VDYLLERQQEPCSMEKDAKKESGSGEENLAKKEKIEKSLHREKKGRLRGDKEERNNY